MNEAHQLSPLQLDIMKALWKLGEGSVGDVNQALTDRDLAPTTVATLLTRMAKKGLVRHRKDGRQYIYRAAVTREEVRNSMVGELTQRLFDGNKTALVSHLIAADEIDSGDLDRVKQLIEAREREMDKEKGDD